ncbi:hypothetical protein [Desulfosporosinus sp. FKB]|uniref:hypothetical protein n=1 Tax=Desulfosporosinus sp. FKB TaxID=1969835 RepID=UPI001FA898F0|nr:hypothetical protein [Desulfosporosinus sp. FKB]
MIKSKQKNYAVWGENKLSSNPHKYYQKESSSRRQILKVSLNIDHPMHSGDLAFDPQSLMTNGDYWYNYEIPQQPRGDFYVQALAFYNTLYESPLVSSGDKTTASQKILNTYNKLLDSADALVLENNATSYAIAAKYYWTVLQGPNLDSAIKNRAGSGYQNASAKANQS